jgi:hypothetical protein
VSGWIDGQGIWHNGPECEADNTFCTAQRDFPLRTRLEAAEKERDEATQRWKQRFREQDDDYNQIIGEVQAENRLLLRRLDILADFAKSIGARSINEGLDIPLTAAEVERVKGLEQQNEQYRAVAEAYRSEWNPPGPTCTCHEGFRSRSRIDPDCMYHHSNAVWDALAALKGEGAKPA